MGYTWTWHADVAMACFVSYGNVTAYRRVVVVHCMFDMWGVTYRKGIE